jgi:predicted amidohydrolase
MSAKVAAIQFVSEFGQPERNRTRLEKLICDAAGNGAKIIALPELAIHGYMSEEAAQTWRRPGWPAMLPLTGVDPLSIAETIPGPTAEQFSALAADSKTYLSVPILERRSDDLFNSVILFDPDGQMLLHYRKAHPWPYVESGWAAAGDRGLQTIDTPFGHLGLLICYDIHFELPNIKARGVDTLLFSSAWFDLPGSDFFRTELPQRAAEFELNIIAANWNVSKKRKWHGYGDSTIIDRTGRVLACAKRRAGDQIVLTEV